MRWLITGAAGFVGTNLSIDLIQRGEDVFLIDDLSRFGVVENSSLLLETYGTAIKVIDVSKKCQVEQYLNSVESIDVIVHLAGQVSFMKSILEPMRDFEINAIGTLNILEYVRNHWKETLVIGVSSNKIYGDLNYVETLESKSRFIAPGYPNGFDESLKLDFHGPYGCSKGIADQYLIDYARMYGLKTISLRQSSIYGPFQRPKSDQGWVSYFLDAITKHEEIILNGRGLQVRDILHVRDWIELVHCISKTKTDRLGKGFNVGGGPDNSISVIELISYVSNLLDVKPNFVFGEHRPSDQKVFVSDNSAIQGATAWIPETKKEEGIIELIEHKLKQK
jgi:CDP-paratose 2-epimerase